MCSNRRAISRSSPPKTGLPVTYHIVPQCVGAKEKQDNTRRPSAVGGDGMLCESNTVCRAQGVS
jgi:hypothetical protein